MSDLAAVVLMQLAVLLMVIVLPGASNWLRS